MQNVRVRFAVFLNQVAITPINYATIDHYQRLLADERRKLHEYQNGKRIQRLEQV